MIFRIVSAEPQNRDLENCLCRISPLKLKRGTRIRMELVSKAAIDYINKIGLDNIHAYETELFEHATAKLKRQRTERIIGGAESRSDLLVIGGTPHPLDIGTILISVV